MNNACIERSEAGNALAISFNAENAELGKGGMNAIYSNVAEAAKKKIGRYP
jgi:hypothetical protein